MPIVWKQQMATGNTIIDDEHKLLICLINSVEIALKAENHGNMIRFLIKELHLYTRNHFTQEEKIMMQYKYKDYVAHKMQHQKILDDLKALEDKLETISNNEESFSQIEDNIADLLRSWIIDHVITTDLKLKPLFETYKSNGIKI